MRTELAVAPAAAAPPDQAPALQRGSSYFDFDHGGKLKLPAALLDELQADLGEGPLVFRVSAGGAAAFAGVLEFTAPEGAVVLPAALQAKLCVSARDVVLVESARLPKATSCKLQPLTSAFLDVPDARAALEAHLRTHFLTLSQGDLVRLHAAGSQFELRVTELQPSPEGCVIANTDLVVDFEAPADADDAAAGVPVVALANAVQGAVQAGDRFVFRVALPHALPGDLALRLQQGEGDASVFLSAVAQRPSLQQHDWRFTGVGAGVVVLPGERLAAAASGLFGVVEAFEQPLAEFRLELVPRSELAPEEDPPSAQLPPPAAEAQAEEDGRRRCPNCRELVPGVHFDRHSAFCERHNKRCPHPDCLRVMKASEFEAHWHCPDCGEVVAEAGRAKHRAVEHSPLACSCGQTLPGLSALVEHRGSCPDRLILCQFCGNTVRAGTAEDPRDRLAGLSGHEAYCGSRSIDCHLCGRAVSMKQYRAHRMALHGDDLEAVPSFEHAALPEPEPVAAAAAAVAPVIEGADEDVVDWNCEICTFRNRVATDNCQTCGGDRPAEGPNAKPAKPAAPAAPPVALLPGQWSCPQCTMRNEASSTECSACSSPQKAAAAAAAAATAPRAVVPRAVQRQGCRNEGCSASASDRGDARVLGLCSRCFGLMPELNDAEDEEELREAMAERYGAGCGARGCSCRQDSAAAAEALAAEAPGRFLLCLPPSAGAAAGVGRGRGAPKRKAPSRGRGSADRIATAMW